MAYLFVTLVVAGLLAVISPLCLFMMKLSVATTPFVFFAGFVAYFLPPLPIWVGLILVGLATLCGIVMMQKCHPEMEQEAWMRPYKIGYFLLVIVAAASYQTLYTPDTKLLQTLSVPMYMLAGRIFFRLRYA